MKKRNRIVQGFLIGACLVTFPLGASAQIIIPDPTTEQRESINDLALPQSLERKTGTFLEGMTHTWYEYLPSSYTGEQAVPLVVSLHGASGTGHDQARSTGWHLVAERDGFIVIFPNSSSNIDVRDSVNRWDNKKDGIDIEYLKELIDYAISEYNIDTSRIYMHGVSNGDMMSLQFAVKHGDMLAGLASSIGPTHWGFFEKGEIDKPTNPLPVHQWRGEDDIIVLAPPREVSFDPAGRDEVNAFNKKLWLDVNGNDLIPEIRIDGKDNLEIYRGGSALFLYNEVKDAPHGQEVYAADSMWSELLSGYSRGPNGEIIPSEPIDSPSGDKNATAIVVGADKAFIDNKVVPLQNGGPTLIDNSIYVPVQFLNHAFGAAVELRSEGKQAIVTTPEGANIAFSQGNAAITVNNRIETLEQKVVLMDGQLMVPMRPISETLFNKNVSYNNGAVYISDHYAELSRGIARTLTNILK
ncbi:stalk domain-containing protein [Bacillus sp. Marseille-P3661]|uniref:stalk domain-containing protein n=1 Tax=Bacillus sp. Marseille-P3661 TaxID=1936234 RepID=UPI000C8671FC|nr:stalk domain-containing protein [Bacillus sp. Marseille-P3661]